MGRRGHSLDDPLVAKALVASAGRSTSPADQTLIPYVANTLGGGTPGGGPKPDTDRMTFIPEAAGSVRRLTPRECERISGWPDDWTRWTADGREIADSHRYRMTGNAVVAPVAEWIGRRLVAVDATLQEAT